VWCNKIIKVQLLIIYYAELRNVIYYWYLATLLCLVPYVTYYGALCGNIIARADDPLLQRLSNLPHKTAPTSDRAVPDGAGDQRPQSPLFNPLRNHSQPFETTP
jgi:hypothetical protein